MRAISPFVKNFVKNFVKSFGKPVWLKKRRNTLVAFCERTVILYRERPTIPVAELDDKQICLRRIFGAVTKYTPYCLSIPLCIAFAGGGGGCMDEKGAGFCVEAAPDQSSQRHLTRIGTAPKEDGCWGEDLRSPVH